MRRWDRRLGGVFALAAACGSLVLGLAEAGKFKPRPLAERLAASDAVVVGKLVEVSTGAYSLPRGDAAGAAVDAFDLGVLRVSAVLKGPAGLKDAKVLLEGEGGGEARPVHVDRRRVGDSGVWLLLKEERTGHYRLFEPEPNPLPVSAKREVERLLEKKR